MNPLVALLGISATSFVVRRGGLLGILLLAMLYVPVTLQYGLPVTNITAFYLVLAGTGVILTIRGRRNLTVNMFGLAAVPTALVLVASLAAHATLATTLNAARPFLAVGLLALGIRLCSMDRPQMLARAIAPLMWAGVAVAALAVYQRAAGVWPVLDQNSIGTQYTSLTYPGRSGGTMGHPIILGAVLAFVLIIAVATRPRLWPFFAAAAGLGVVLSGSRSAFVALAVVGVAAAITERRRLFAARNLIPGLWSLALGTLLALIFAGGWVNEVAGELYRRAVLSGDESVGQRSDRYNLAWNLITENTSTVVFGRGPGFDVTYLRTVNAGFSSAFTFDNTYVSVWMNYGIVVLALMIVAVAIAAKRSSGLGRAIILLAAVEGMFFELTSWPAMLAMLALGLGVSRRSYAGDDDPGSASALERHRRVGRKTARGRSVDGLRARGRHGDRARASVLDRHLRARTD